jgi:hypothetical protein
MALPITRAWTCVDKRLASSDTDPAYALVFSSVTPSPGDPSGPTEARRGFDPDCVILPVSAAEYALCTIGTGYTISIAAT